MFPLLIPFLAKAATITVSEKLLIGAAASAIAYNNLKNKETKHKPKEKPKKD